MMSIASEPTRCRDNLSNAVENNLTCCHDAPPRPFAHLSLTLIRPGEHGRGPPRARPSRVPRLPRALLPTSRPVSAKTL